jgi:hypothetical protein
MSTAVPRLPGRGERWRQATGRVVAGLAIAGIGIIVGLQYILPDKRMLAVLSALVLFGIAWRLDLVAGIGLLVIAIPYPRGTVFGSTNVAFILLLLVIWLLRVALRQGAAARRTPVDAPIVALVVAYVVSFYNVADAESLDRALKNMELFVMSVGLFYLATNNLRTEADLKRLQTFQAVSLATICLLSVYELNHPGGQFIPGWIDFSGTQGTELNTHNVRVNGPFFDFELLSEFCALQGLLVAFLIIRARSVAQRVVYVALLLLDIFVMYTTVTRGAIIALMLGLGYLLFGMRRHLRAVPLMLTGGSLAALAVLMNFYVAHFTRSGNLGQRLSGTTFVGLVPDSRTEAWKSGWTRFLQHPWIGRGPYYSPYTGTTKWFWPHDLYLLVANMVGVVGLTFFLIVLLRILWLTRPTSWRLDDPSYARAFLIIAHVQLVIFLVDEIKIDYVRNPIYQFEVWLMLAVAVAAARLARGSGPRAALRAT